MTASVNLGLVRLAADELDMSILKVGYLIWVISEKG